MDLSFITLLRAFVLGALSSSVDIVGAYYTGTRYWQQKGEKTYRERPSVL
jgi:hypothetical protein